MKDKIFIKREASVLPKESGYYNTDRGEMYFNAPQSFWDIRYGANSEEFLKVWWEPYPQKLTLEEAKDKFVQPAGFKNWDQYIDDMPGSKSIFNKIISGVSDIYLSSNTSHLLEEIEELKKNQKQMEIIQGVSDESLGERGLKIFELEQQVKVLRNTLEEIKTGNYNSKRYAVYLAETALQQTTK